MTKYKHKHFPNKTKNRKQESVLSFLSKRFSCYKPLNRINTHAKRAPLHAACGRQLARFDCLSHETRRKILHLTYTTTVNMSILHTLTHSSDQQGSFSVTYLEGRNASSLAASLTMKHREHELPLPVFAGITNQLPTHLNRLNRQIQIPDP